MQKIEFPNMHTGNRCSKMTRAEVSEAELICIDIAGERRNSVQYDNLVHEFVPTKRSEECSSPYFLIFKVKAGACCLVSRRGVSVGQNSSSDLKNPGSTRYAQVWIWKERGANSEFCCAQRISGVHTNNEGCTHK